MTAPEQSAADLTATVLAALDLAHNWNDEYGGHEIADAELIEHLAALDALTALAARAEEAAEAVRLSKERATLILRLARAAGVGLDERNALEKIEHAAEHWLGIVARAALKEDSP